MKKLFLFHSSATSAITGPVFAAEHCRRRRRPDLEDAAALHPLGSENVYAPVNVVEASTRRSSLRPYFSSTRPPSLPPLVTSSPLNAIDVVASQHWRPAAGLMHSFAENSNNVDDDVMSLGSSDSSL